MSLDLNKLERIRELAGGLVQARCPACAEGGHDRTGEHLRIYPDGRFGCCVHPKDCAHRKRIFALAGVRGKLPFLSPRTFTLRINTPPAMPAAQSVKAALTEFANGTHGTPQAGLVSANSTIDEAVNGECPTFGTDGTAELKLRACAREELHAASEEIPEKLKDLESVVPSVPTDERLPFLTAGGDLSIPFDSTERYHWWKGGQSVTETLKEVKERIKHAVTV